MESKFQLALPRLPTIASILFVTLCSLHGLMGECPRLCECKWKSGKESVLCLNANLSNIPSRLDGGTQVLDLTGNDISNIPHDAFASANLLNLQKVFLSKCRLKVIERFAFRKLNNLVELDLSYNFLTMVPSHSFDSISELREIKLTGNPIQRIVNDAFSRVPQLIRLELSDCKIGNLEPRSFAGLEASLEWLKLDGNKLIEVRSEILTAFRNLHGLELARNPWNCSCTLRPLRAWMLRENIPYGIPPVCRLPGRLTGKSWDKIDLDDFACVPQIVAPDTRAHGVEGNNITISCIIVEGVPEPNVRWFVKNRVIANLSGETVLPAAQGRKMYMVNLLKNASNLTILTADMQDAGIYTCAAENKAGRVDASVTLAVSRKPPQAPLGAKVILVCVLIAVLLVVMSSLGALCFCSLRKKRKIIRWSTPARSDSYEKIEMSRKSDLRQFRGDENGYIGPHTENGIAFVNPTKKNGDYRNVPTEDDDTGYEDNNEAVGCTGFNRRDNPSKWKGASIKSPTETKLNIDLHIPRLVDVSSTPDSGSSSVSSQVDAATRLAEATGGAGINFVQQKPSWSNQFLSKKAQVLSSFDHSTSDMKNMFCQTRTAEMNLCDGERKYPDLLDVSSFGSANTTAFCTLPRKIKTCQKYFKNSSDSQSPLLPESSSKYSSSTLGDFGLPADISSRRFSAESYSNYLSTKPSKPKNTSNQQRSSSFLSLVSTTGQINHHRNPSLPSSPIRESHQRSLSSAATPLLDFSSLTGRAGLVPSTSATVSAYDYHAAQLERFLEEYRNLQEQLCKMKETCESIRKKEAPLRGALGHSAAQYADPVMFNAAMSGNNLVVEPPNPKTMLKNKSILPGQPPDPPPYWLHRNAMLKRLNDSQSEFFQS